MDDRLRKFACLVESRSFTHAAKKLHISQPALTLSINKLERELKMPLVVRGHGGLELTSAGQIVYDAAKTHRTADDNLRTKLAELSDRRPQVTIGMIDSVAAALNDEPAALDELESQADVSIVVNHSRYLRIAVENREVDLAIAVPDNAIHPNLAVESLGSELFVLACQPDRLKHFQAALEAKKLREFISYDRNSTTYSHLYAGLLKLGISTPPILYSTSPTIMLHTILRGRGVAALPYILTKELLKNGRLAALQKNGRALTIECPLSFVKLRGKLLPGVLGNFSAQTQRMMAADGKVPIVVTASS